MVDEPALVGEDDGLDAVAKDELGEDVRDVRLTVCLADEELVTVSLPASVVELRDSRSRCKKLPPALPVLGGLLTP